MNIEWKQGWRAVLSGSVGMGTGLGLYSMLNSVFVIPLSEEFGWERGEMALSNVIGLIALTTLPLLGALVDRYDSRRVACIGLFLLSFAYIGLSLQQGSLLIYYVTLLLMTFFGQATGPMIFTKVVNTWFHGSRGLALGVTMSGITLTSMVLLPLFAHIIELWGWRWAFVCFAMVPLLIGLPVVAWGLKPASAGYLSDLTGSTSEIDIQEGGRTMKQSLLSPKFWFLGGALVCANIAVGGMLHQMQPVLVDQGFSMTQAASLGVVFFFAVAVGRLSSGWMLDRFWAPGVAGVYLLLPLAGIAIFLSGAPAVMSVGFAAVFFLGLAQGAEVDFLAYLVPRYFGLVNYGKLFGILLFVLASSLALGGYLFGLLFDRFESYELALLIAAGAYVASSLLIILSGVLGEDFDHTK